MVLIIIIKCDRIQSPFIEMSHFCANRANAFPHTWFMKQLNGTEIVKKGTSNISNNCDGKKTVLCISKINFISINFPKQRIFHTLHSLIQMLFESILYSSYLCSAQSIYCIHCIPFVCGSTAHTFNNGNCELLCTSFSQQ